jgi:hypothetical protein
LNALLVTKPERIRIDSLALLFGGLLTASKPAQRMVHDVEQGEHLFRIARQYGFRNPYTVWKDSNNASLRDLRSNPNVLFPGDQLFIPERQEKTEVRSTNQVHQFVAELQNLRLAIVVRDANSDPIANEQCVLAVELVYLQVNSLTTDEQGRIEQEIDSTAIGGEVRIRGQVYFLKIGDLDPVSELSGQRARLANLGYYFGDGSIIDEAELRTAVEEFQCDYELSVDGVCGPKTQQKLLEVHGC